MYNKRRTDELTEHVSLISFRAAKEGPLRSTIVLGTTGDWPWASLQWGKERYSGVRGVMDRQT
jgi:hypothetical protein